VPAGRCFTCRLGMEKVRIAVVRLTLELMLGTLVVGLAPTSATSKQGSWIGSPSFRRPVDCLWTNGRPHGSNRPAAPQPQRKATWMCSRSIARPVAHVKAQQESPA
jgi:hypothetical protein